MGRELRPESRVLAGPPAPSQDPGSQISPTQRPGGAPRPRHALQSGCGPQTGRDCAPGSAPACACACAGGGDRQAPVLEREGGSAGSASRPTSPSPGPQAAGGPGGGRPRRTRAPRHRPPPSRHGARRLGRGGQGLGLAGPLGPAIPSPHALPAAQLCPSWPAIPAATLAPGAPRWWRRRRRRRLRAVDRSRWGARTAGCRRVRSRAGGAGGHAAALGPGK